MRFQHSQYIKRWSLLLPVLFLCFFVHSAEAKKPISLKLDSSSIVRGEYIQLSGRVLPRKKGKRVKVYRKQSIDKKYKFVATVKTKKRGTYSYRTKPKRDMYYVTRFKQHGEWVKSKRRKLNVWQYTKCGNTNTWYSVAPVDIEFLAHIVPLGNLNPSGHTFPTQHTYLSVNHDPDNTGLAAPYSNAVYAPGDIWVTDVTSSNNTTQGISDYSITFRPCIKVSGYYYHIDEFSSKLKKAINKAKDPNCYEYSTGGNDYTHCTYSVRKKFSAGEVLGYVGGDSSTSTFDFGTYDMRTDELDFVNKDRKYESQLHIVCPYNYYSEPAKSELKSLLGSTGALRTEKPICGEVEQDEPGTAQGNWYLPGSDPNSSSEDQHLALVHDNIDPTQGTFSVGTSLDDIDSATYPFTPVDSGVVNRDFDQVTADGNTYCYEIFYDTMAILITMPNSETLRIEKRPDVTNCDSDWEMSKNYTKFIR